ncbi:MAG: Crp/Fnr family transcriptional regulator [Eubacteriales bacterium]
MNDIINKLQNFTLLKGLDKNTITKALEISKYSIKHYNPEEVIAFEASHCNHLGLILDGIISVNKIYPSGRTVSIATLNIGKVFGEVILFSNHNIYPSTIIASSQCEIIFFDREHFINMCNYYPNIYENLLHAFSDRILLLNQKITNLSFKSIRQKIIHHLFEVYKIQKSLYLELYKSRNEWAELLGIPRPSLSRELIKMKNDGLIDYDKSTIKIVDLNKLENELFK